MPSEPTSTQIVNALASDFNPSSPDHWVRLICGGFCGIIGGALLLGKVLWLRQELTMTEAIIGGALILLGAGVVFTRTTLTVMKAGLAYLPWRKKDSG